MDAEPAMLCGDEGFVDDEPLHDVVKVGRFFFLPSAVHSCFRRIGRLNSAALQDISLLPIRHPSSVSMPRKEVATHSTFSPK
jgi:hypothetical protein